MMIGRRISHYWERNMFKIIWVLFIGITIFLAGFYYETMINNFTTILVEIELDNIQTEIRNDYILERNAKIKFSIDCNELQFFILELLSEGGNADKWLPSSTDRLLKIGQERFEVLKC